MTAVAAMVTLQHWKAFLGDVAQPMDQNLFRYIWRHSKHYQIRVLCLVLLSMPFYYVSLDLPKQIVNQGIEGQGFTGPDDTQPYFSIHIPYSQEIFGQTVTMFDGLELGQMDALLVLSFVFLGLVIVNGYFKYVINTRKGQMGERMLRRLRYQLSDRLLRFPLPYMRKVKQAEVATMIKDEVEPLGGFIGEAFVNPVFLGGQALTAMAFILAQSWILGSVAAAVVIFQAALIPKLRIPILRLGRQRQLTARELAGRLGETIAGATEVHAHDTSNYERAELVSRLARIYDIRYEIYRRKFFVKFLNNFLAQVTPFIFYVVGGVLAIAGELDIGALVAVIAAYKDLPSPIKELIDWDQRRQDVQIKYEQVIEQFAPPVLIDPQRQDPDAEGPTKLEGQIELRGVAVVDDSDRRLLDAISFTAALTEHVAVVGPGGGGKEYLPLVVAGLEPISTGHASIGGHELGALPQAVTGRRLGYVAADAHFFAGSLRKNLLYGLLHKPLRPPEREPAAQRAAEADRLEAQRAGNPYFDFEADWVDYEAAGARDAQELDHRLLEAIQTVELEEDLYRFGLLARFNPEEHTDLADQILSARQALAESLHADGHDDLIVRFDPGSFNPNASLAENLLFGSPLDARFEPDQLLAQASMKEAVEAEALEGDLEAVGLEIARTMVEIFADLPPGHPFFEQFSFIDAEELPEFRSLVGRQEKGGMGGLTPEDRGRLMRIALDYVEARHRLGLISPERAERIVRTRKRFADLLAKDNGLGVAFYDPDTYNPAATLQDNVLFGRLAFGQAQGEETVQDAIIKVLDDQGLRERVIELGMTYDVGVAGKRLNNGQKQKAALARSLVKRPDLLVLNEALAALDSASQRRILERVLETRKGQGVFWSLYRPDFADAFDKILVLEEGRLVEQGSFADLNKDGQKLRLLLETSGAA